MELVIGPDGTVRAIYSDELVPLMPALGTVQVRRASHVEPGDWGWVADMAPVNGPRLGPYRLRSEALAAEVEWLREHGTPFPGAGE